MMFDETKLIFSAMSKYLFYYRMYISQYILHQNFVPLNSFMNFEYFMLDTVERDTIIKANNELVKIADELWVFGQISEGVLLEIILAQKMNKPIRYFKIYNKGTIEEITKKELIFEPDVVSRANEVL